MVCSQKLLVAVLAAVVEVAADPVVGTAAAEPVALALVVLLAAVAAVQVVLVAVLAVAADQVAAKVA